MCESGYSLQTFKVGSLSFDECVQDDGEKAEEGVSSSVWVAVGIILVIFFVLVAICVSRLVRRLREKKAADKRRQERIDRMNRARQRNAPELVTQTLDALGSGRGRNARHGLSFTAFTLPDLDL